MINKWNFVSDEKMKNHLQSSNYFITIAIPTFKHNVELERLLESIYDTLKDSEHIDKIEIFISDDNPNDTVNPLLVEKYKNLGLTIRYVRQELQLGPDLNFMFLFKNARGKFILLLHDYMIVLKNNILKLIEKTLAIMSSDLYKDVKIIYLNKRGHKEDIIDYQKFINSCDLILDRILISKDLVNEILKNDDYKKFMNGFCFLNYFFYPKLIMALKFISGKIISLPIYPIIHISYKKDSHMPYQIIIDHTYITVINLTNLYKKSIIDKKTYEFFLRYYLDLEYVKHSIYVFGMLKELRFRYMKSNKDMLIFRLIFQETLFIFKEMYQEFHNMMPIKSKIFTLLFVFFLFRHEWFLYFFYYVLEGVGNFTKIFSSIRYKLSAQTVAELTKSEVITYWERATYEKSGIPIKFLKRHQAIIDKIKEINKN